MERNKGSDEISSEDMVLFYGDAIANLAVFTTDPYGLIGDLGALLTIFGAEFDDSGNMLSIKPIPYMVMKYFEMGYDNGKLVAQQDKENAFLDFHQYVYG